MPWSCAVAATCLTTGSLTAPRYRVKPTTYNTVDDLLDIMASSYRRALWDDQYVHMEIWVEKDAITSVISSVTAEWDVPILVARGFASETFLYATAQDIISDDKPAVIYQLGDHDPSGVAAWEHTQRRLQEFAPETEFVFERLAVTPEQIEQFALPMRPTKKSNHTKGFTGDSVEVDAVPSTDLRAIVREAIEQRIDVDALRSTRMVEVSERAGLEALATAGIAT